MQQFISILKRSLLSLMLISFLILVIMKTVQESDRLRYKLVTYQPLNSPPAKGSQQKVPFESYQIGAVQS
jgi:hypothetical protein